MFGFLKKKTEPKKSEGRLRGILPTYVTDAAVILCKNSRFVRNTYEIRLALYMAITEKKQFVLAVPVGAQVSPELQSKIYENGGAIEEKEIKSYSVYIGHFDGNGVEGDGWVLGGENAWSAFRGSLCSLRLKERLTIGNCLKSDDIELLEKDLSKGKTAQTNVDDENLKEVLLVILAAAREQGGELFIQ